MKQMARTLKLLSQQCLMAQRKLYKITQKEKISIFLQIKNELLSRMLTKNFELFVQLRLENSQNPETLTNLEN